MLSSWNHRVSVQMLLGLAILAASAVPAWAQGPAGNWQPSAQPYYQMLLQQEMLLLQLEQQQIFQQQMMLNWYRQQMAQGTAQRQTPPAAANAPRSVPTATASTASTPRTTPPTPASHARKNPKR